jgi:hypothetical protein
MYNPDTELLFPPRVIPSLRNLRGEGWKTFIEGLLDAGETSPERLGFVLMMARECGCVSCSAENYRAIQGCSSCARQTVEHLRGKDEELIRKHAAVMHEVEKYLTAQNDKKPTSADVELPSDEEE